MKNARLGSAKTSQHGQEQMRTTESYQGPAFRTSDENLSAAELRDLASYLTLPHKAMREVGPAARLMGAFYELVDHKTGKTFASVKKIGEAAVLPVRTTHRYLDKLVAAGWVARVGRERSTNRRRLRRTITYGTTKKAWKHRKPYSVWPKWLGTFEWQLR